MSTWTGARCPPKSETQFLLTPASYWHRTVQFQASKLLNCWGFFLGDTGVYPNFFLRHPFGCHVTPRGAIGEGCLALSSVQKLHSISVVSERCHPDVACKMSNVDKSVNFGFKMSCFFFPTWMWMSPVVLRCLYKQKLLQIEKKRLYFCWLLVLVRYAKQKTRLVSVNL